MTYDDLEASVAEGRPYFLYLFAEESSVWRFTSRAADWISPAGAIADETEDLAWTTSAISHGSVMQSGDPRRTDLSVTFPISDVFARRWLGPRGHRTTTLTIFRGHEQVPAEVFAHWKGRVVSARTEGARIVLRCESLFTSMRREGVRAKYQRLCRHALYGRGCRLDLEGFLTPATASTRIGLQVTVPEAATESDGWYRGGVLRHAGLPAFILEHVGDVLTLGGRLPELEAAIDDPQTVAAVEIAPGCDLRSETCREKFDNLANFGGFPLIPGRNPFGGGSVV